MELDDDDGDRFSTQFLRKRTRENEESRRSSSEDIPLRVYSIYCGKVVSIREFGVFVAIENVRRHGLVHISQVSKQRISNKEELEKVLAIGDKVWVKITGITDDGKIQMSMKYVSQTDGNDLDPNLVEHSVQSQRTKHVTHEIKSIEIGAILNTNCTRCGGRGHLASECYVNSASNEGGRAKYELLESPPSSPHSTEVTSKENEDSKKRKDEKVPLSMEKNKSDHHHHYHQHHHGKQRKEKKEKKHKKDQTDKKARHH
jgi:predicted RNA-binding protein with RPS1 domain